MTSSNGRVHRVVRKQGTAVVEKVLHALRILLKNEVIVQRQIAELVVARDQLYAELAALRETMTEMRRQQEEANPSNLIQRLRKTKEQTLEDGMKIALE